VIFAAVDPEKRDFSLPKASSGCFVGAVAVIALLGFGLLATLLSLVGDEPGPPATTGGAEVPPAGAVLLAEQGSAPLTAMLATGRAWDLRWSFDCTARPAGTGRFAVDLDGPGPPPGVDERGAHGRGTERVAAGVYRLTVRSLCPWTLTAVTA
jgi:hypothetical protein